MVIFRTKQRQFSLSIITENNDIYVRSLNNVKDSGTLLYNIGQSRKLKVVRYSQHNHTSTCKMQNMRATNDKLKLHQSMRKFTLTSRPSINKINKFNNVRTALSLYYFFLAYSVCRSKEKDIIYQFYRTICFYKKYSSVVTEGRQRAPRLFLISESVMIVLTVVVLAALFDSAIIEYSTSLSLDSRQCCD